jgi:UDP-glucuronate 4-epimerase
MTAQHQPKTVLVTGGAGFIGSHLCQMLLNEGIRVINIDNYNDFYNPAIKENNVKVLLQDPDRFIDIRVDLMHQEALAKVFDEWGSQIDQVVHLAGKAGVRPSLQDPGGYLETNVTGTLNLLEQMRCYDITRMIFASSSSVYGNRTDPPFREDQDISKPISPYAATKAMAEALLHTYSHLYGIQMAVLRFFTVYGPRQRPDLAIHTFTRQIESGQPITLFGDGTTQRDYTYIDDILQGIRGAMAYTATPFEIFNLGESQPVFLHQLIHLLEDFLGKQAQIRHQPMQAGDVLMTCADISKARQLLGYAPQTPIEHGLEKFVNWYRQLEGAISSIK